MSASTPSITSTEGHHDQAQDPAPQSERTVQAAQEVSRAPRIKTAAWVALGVLALLILTAPPRRRPRLVIDVYDQDGNLEASSELERL